MIAFLYSKGYMFDTTFCPIGKHIVITGKNKTKLITNSSDIGFLELSFPLVLVCNICFPTFSIITKLNLVFHKPPETENEIPKDTK